MRKILIIKLAALLVFLLNHAWGSTTTTNTKEKRIERAHLSAMQVIVGIENKVELALDDSVSKGTSLCPNDSPFCMNEHQKLFNATFPGSNFSMRGRSGMIFYKGDEMYYDGGKAIRAVFKSFGNGLEYHVIFADKIVKIVDAMGNYVVIKVDWEGGIRSYIIDVKLPFRAQSGKTALGNNSVVANNNELIRLLNLFFIDAIAATPTTGDVIKSDGKTSSLNIFQIEEMLSKDKGISLHQDNHNLFGYSNDLLLNPEYREFIYEKIMELVR